MKKIYILILSFIIFLFGCSNKEKDQVEILINSDIKIEISNIDNFQWKRVITIKVNGEIMPFGDTLVTLKDEDVNVNEEAEFLVSYEYNGEIYTEILIAYIYKSISYKYLDLIFLDGQKKQYSFNASEKYLLDNIDTYIEGYRFDGWYKDSLYINKYNDNYVNDSIKLYGKWIKNNNYNLKDISYSKIKDEMDFYIDNLINNTTSYIPSWNQEGFKGRWNYIDGVFLNSILNLYKETNEQKYIDFIVNYVNCYINSAGVFINPETLEPNYKSDELDSVCASRILFDLYEYTKDSRYLNAINYTYQQLMNMSKTINGINYSHKETYLNQIWLDGMYMYVPFLARYALMVNDDSIFIDIKNQYEYIRNNMFDEEKSLYYHGHDTTKSIFWANKTTGNSGNFWLRSMGWYIVSLVDVLEYYPSITERQYLIDILNEAVNGILKYQDDESKMFYQIIDRPAITYLIPSKYLSGLKNDYYGSYNDRSISNYLETSGSAMIAYSLLKASKMNYIDARYYNIGEKIYEGIYSYSFNDFKLDNICITAGLGPESNLIRDGSVYYYLAEKVGSDDAKGVGPFIMAYLEYRGGKL